MGVTTADEEVVSDSPKGVSSVRQTVRYCLHLAAVYLIVNSTTMWLAGRVRETVLPLIQQHPPTESSFQFLFSHLFVFSLFPALLVAFAAFHEYFGGGFLIAEFHNYRELFQLYGNPDMRRGMQQLNATAPVYAAIGYSIGTWLGMHCNVPHITAMWRTLKPKSPVI